MCDRDSTWRLVGSLAVVLICGQLAHGASELRTWIDATGKFKTEATLVESGDGQVKLRRSDGKLLTLPLAKLSKKDQAFVKSQRSMEKRPESKTKAARTPKVTPIPKATGRVTSGPDGDQWRLTGKKKNQDISLQFTVSKDGTKVVDPYLVVSVFDVAPGVTAVVAAVPIKGEFDITGGQCTARGDRGTVVLTFDGDGNVQAEVKGTVSASLPGAAPSEVPFSDTLEGKKR